MDHKDWLIRGVFLTLLLGTLYGLFLPIYQQKKAEADNQEVVTGYHKAAKKADASAKEYQEKYNDYLLKKGGMKDAARPKFSSMTSTEEGAIGTLQFPTVRVSETPIYKEETGRSLFHYKYGSFPTEGSSGHLVISVGNRWRDQTRLAAIGQLAVGDRFFLRIGKHRQAYQIVTIEKRREPRGKFTKNEQYLTMMMKDSSGFTNEPIEIVSRRIPIKQVNEARIIPRITVSYQVGVMVFLLLNSVIFSRLVLHYHRNVRLAHSNSFRTKTGGFRQLRNLLKLTRGYYIILSLIMGIYLAFMFYRVFYLR